MSDEKNANSSDAVERALKSVEALAHESADDLDPDAIEVLHADDLPPSGDPSDEGHAPVDADLEREFADADEDALEAEVAGAANDDEDEDGASPPPKKADPKDAMLEAMIKAKHELSEILDQTQKEAKSLHDRLLRVTADYENFKKRQTREKEDALKFANERLLKDLLPSIDNMERAADVAGAALKEVESDVVKSVIEGVEMVRKSFMDTFLKFGVVPFSAQGQQFDPAKHEAVAQREDPSVPHNSVLEEYQRGYMLHDRLVRPAMVIVASGGPAPGANGATPAGDGEDLVDDERDEGGDGEGGEGGQ